MYQDSQVLSLNIDDILPNRFQPRIKFNEQAINELAESIKVHGVIQPIVVRKISDKYEIIAGERRYKASVLAGKMTIPAIVVSLDDKNSAEIALIENVQRQNLTPIEEAISYKKILDMGYISQVALGEKLGKTQSTIANKLRLLNLNEEVQDALMDGKISERHARSLLRLSDEMQVVMLNRIINERLTVRRTDEEIEKLLNNNSNESGNQKELGRENNMNNDILKDLNIPTEPIIEDIDDNLNKISNSMMNEMKEENEKPMQNINNVNENINISPNNSSFENNSLFNKPSSLNNNIVDNESAQTEEKTINPGFMDVDKIESEAEEIYKEQTPVADIDMLLDTSKNPVVEEQVSPMQQVPTMNDDNNDQPISGGKFFTMFNMNQEEENPDYVSDIESKEVNMDFGIPKPDNLKTFNFDAFNQTVDENQDNIGPGTNDDMYPPIKPVELENNLTENETPETELDKTMDFSKTLETYSLTDDEKFTNDVENISEVKQPEPVISSVAPLGVNKDITFDDMGEIEVKIPESHQKLTTANFKTVINTIRECAKTIEKFGFTIDTEEIDLEDSYQVIFKIDKN